MTNTSRVLLAMACAALAAVVVLGLLLASAREPTAPDSFTYSGREFSIARLKAFIGDRRVRSLSSLRREVEAFAEDVVLREAARERGLDASGPVDRIARALLEQAGRAPSVSDVAIEEYYLENRDRWVHPRRLRVVYFRIAKNAQRESSLERARAARILAQVNRSPLAMQRLLGRDLEGVESGRVGPVLCNGTAQGALPADVVVSACELGSGSLSPIIDVPDAFYFVIEQNSEAARAVPLGTARAEIEQDLLSAGWAGAKRGLMNELLGQAEVELSPRLQPLVQPASRVAWDAHAEESRPPRPPGDSDG